MKAPLKIFPKSSASKKKIHASELYLELLEFKETQAKNANIKRVSKKLNCYWDVQFLTKLNQQLESNSSKLPFAFSTVLLNMSGRYQRIFAVAAGLKLPIQPIMMTRFQFLESFDPFSGYINYSNIKENLEWFVDRPADSLLVKDMMVLMHFNSGTHHDLLHSIFSILIAPASKQDLRDYYLFIEALSFIQEYYLSKDFGPHWSQVFSAMNITYRFYDHEAIDKQGSKKEVFLGLLLTHLASLHAWTKTKAKKKFPSNAPFIHGDKLGFQSIFHERITQDWLKVFADRKYPAAYTKRRSASPYASLDLKSYRLDDLVNSPKELDKIWNWAKELLEK